MKYVKLGNSDLNVSLREIISIITIVFHAVKFGQLKKKIPTAVFTPH